ncbi:multiheme c-type cytochrome [Desulfuromonas acetoxidans]|uniref:multiheme c-type cytochrome n=1 Tax=Desulfuromonas acetoxidans TaxID=891 RepID=UPI0029311FFF|nr:multiheme c-type cytochrome [Desulfuromonas acetoxidans]
MNHLLGSRHTIILAVLLVVATATATFAQQKVISDDTQECLDCHTTVTPGIVADWQKSRHSHTTPQDALALPEIERRMSTAQVDETLNAVVIGCAECHTMNADQHENDRFEHNGFVIHTVVSPSDCATCHPVEVEDFSHNLMSQAYANLMDNPVYKVMVDNTNGLATFNGASFHHEGADDMSNADSCLACHGTIVQVTGSETRETDMGEMDFPTLSNWPNAGVGRINPDGSKGACASCHMRHQFSIEVARKPYTCAECHKGPDVPAYKVYSVSVHGNIQKSVDKYWDYKAVPWTVGKDFTAPTCAACHVSELVNSDGEILAKRSHRMTDRLPWRIFGLPYAHPHPINADTTTIVNQGGLTLPTELTGEPVTSALISADEMAVRTTNMKNVCSGCHAQQWVDGHFARLDRSIETSNYMTLQATKVLSTAWEEGLAQGLPQGANPFDEAIEMKWIEQWLFYGNSVRFATAMGGVDYGVFADGRWTQAKNLQEMADYLKFLRAGQEKK